MGTARSYLLGFSLQDRLAAMSWLELVLWFGMASLTVALLILMGTRWGQVRPVSKCVALSVFAHVLFLAYAYGTKLHVDASGWGRETTVRVSFRDDEESLAADEPVLPPGEAPPSLTLDPLSADSLSADQPSADPLAENSPPAPNPETPVPAEVTASTPPPAGDPPPLLPDPATEEPTEAMPEEALVDADSPPGTTEPVEITIPDESPQPDSTSPQPTAPVEVATREPANSEPMNAEPAANEPAPQNAPEVAANEGSMSETGAREDSASASLAEALARNTPQPPAPRRPVDDQPVPEPYRLRNAENRFQLALPFGATERSEVAVQAALGWLAGAQSPDGHWDASDFGAGRETKTLGHDRQGAGETADTGITGLALLALLGSGETHVRGQHAATVQHGLEFLLRSQAADGNLAGPARLFEKMYCHGIATLALSESYALTGDPRLKEAVERAIAYSVNSQHPTAGGWRYQPGDLGDVSQFGWQVMALRSAELGGVPIPDRTRLLMLKFLDSASSGRSRGLVSYRPRERATRTMTAEGMACRYFLGVPPGSAASREATDFLLQELPGQGTPNLYYWYYATLALFQDQGPAWQTWNNALQPWLVERQRRDGKLAGSWDTDDVWGGYGGRVYTTAMGALCLEVYYRYLPLYHLPDDTRQADAMRVAEPWRR